MQSWRRHRNRFLEVPGPWVLGAVLILLIVALLRFFAPDAFMVLVRPIAGVGTAASTVVGAVLPDGGDVPRADYDALRAENTTLATENAALRARLSETDTVSGDGGVASLVMMGPPLAPYDVLVVAAGSQQGVMSGQLAYAGGVPVGRVADVSANTARVLLFSSAGEETAGWVGEERLPINVRGVGAGAFAADVARDAVVVEGDIVYFPGPGAVPMGTVARVESHASAPRATVSIRPLANPFRITSVRIMTVQP